MTSKYKQIRQALENNQDVFMMAQILDSFSSPRFYKFVKEALMKNVRLQDVIFRVAPINGIYDIGRMNKFMNGLVRGLRPYRKYPFDMKIGKKIVCLGELDFHERFASESIHYERKVDLLNEDLIGSGAKRRFVNGTTNIEKRRVIGYTRSIRIFAYPNQTLVRIANEESEAVDEAIENNYHFPGARFDNVEIRRECERIIGYFSEDKE